ncbi:expressed protein [Echinococcus multilocularis]|uniref:Expressed protein n=1 Tax=Echinococcus multilocularis TaxID=6211 RepID=A0A087W0V7_ECHMU|nr:expressed protein [Echinococcus multilocularis]
MASLPFPSGFTSPTFLANFLLSFFAPLTALSGLVSFLPLPFCASSFPSPLVLLVLLPPLLSISRVSAVACASDGKCLGRPGVSVCVSTHSHCSQTYHHLHYYYYQ